MSTEGKKLLYLGSDNAYFKTLLSEFQRLYPGVAIEQHIDSGPEHIQAMLIHVTKVSPALIFVDFSKDTDNYMHLARLLVRTNHSSPLLVMGLHDYLSPAEQHKESFLTGVSVNHIKSGEVFDVVFSAMNLVTPGLAKEHGFASAKVEKELEVHHLCKIGFVFHNGIHVETSLDYEQGEELIVRHPWHDRKKIQSPLMKVIKKTTDMRFYHSSCALDLNFAWVDPVVTNEGDSEERINELTEEREHSVNKARIFLESWLKDNLEKSFKKSVRVLVIDRNMSFYQSAQRTDKFNQAIRCQPFLKDPVDELQSLHPQFIAIVLDGTPTKDGTQPPLNDMAFVQKLTQILTKKLTAINPYIIVFNTGLETSKELQSSMGYAQLIAMNGELTTEVVLKMASMVDKKIQDEAVEEMGDPNLTVYLRKSNPLSIAEIDDVINLIQVSESDLVFTCKRQLKEGTSFRLESPFKGYITVASHPQLGKPPAYYALINCIGETEKKTLRRFVNSVFFKDHDAAKLAELENFQNLNQAKWQELLNKQKAKLEEDEKQKQEQEVELKRAQEAKELSAASPETTESVESKEEKPS